MKLSKLAKTLPIVLGLGVCANANAGVSATSYLSINDLFVEISTDGNTGNGGEVAPGDIASFIAINTGVREGNSNANYNGSAAADAKVDNTGIGTADAALVCVGPSCAGLNATFNGVGLLNNEQSSDGAPTTLNPLVADATEDYAISDMNISGNAIGAGANGFTYGDVGISVPNAIATASSAIFNNLTTTLTVDVAIDLDLRFTALYDMLVDSIITPSVADNDNINGTASASSSFQITLNPITGTLNGAGAGVADGFQFQDLAIDETGLGNLNTFSADNAAYLSQWFRLTAGRFQVTFVQESVAQASLVPEPGAIALFGMGLLGLGLSARRKLTK